MSFDLTDEQRAAIECRDHDILVEAGAGSGKTSTTVQRYMRLLDEGLEPSEILVFTFTDKAANELRERVRAGRESRRDEGGTSFSMSSAWIGTFHSICAGILRSEPIQADVDPAFGILDDIQAERLKADSYERALREFMDTPEREEMVSRFYPPHLRRGVSNAYEQLRSRGQVRPELPVPPVTDPGEALADLRRDCSDAADTPGLRKPTPEKIAGLLDFLDAKGDGDITFAELDQACFESSSAKIKPLMATIKRARAALAVAEFGDEIRIALNELVGLYADLYARAKRDGNVLDYEDLQLRTLDLLRRDGSIAGVYQERFKEIMVDEFQDTNRLQLDLIEALRGPETRLFTVGDEMQAIYGFRHADVRLFRSRRDGRERPVTVLPLSANFRSQAPVIGAVNQIGRALDDDVKRLRGDETGEDRHSFAPLRVGLEPGTYDGEEIEILFTENEGWAGFDLGPMSPPIDLDEHDAPATSGSYEAEALLLAQHLKATLDRTGIAPADTAVLFRAKSRIPLFAEALTQVGLVPYVVGGSGFWDSREGMDLRCLLAVIANPLDDESLLGALAGPACGLTTDALLLLSRAGGSESLWPALVAFATGEPAGGPGADLAGTLGDTDHSRANRFVQTIRRIRASAASTPLGELVEAVVTDTGYDLANLIRDPDASGLANLRRIASLAATYERTEGRDLRGFLDWAALSASLDSEDAVATQEEESDVVRLMTVHKSKGLEFELVCAADLGRGNNAVSETVFWIGPDPAKPDGDGPDAGLRFGLRLPQPDGSTLDLFDWDLLAEAAREDRADEELRLFHVALTRAKRRLIMSGTANLAKSDAVKESSPMAMRLAGALMIGVDQPESVAYVAAEGLPTLASPPEPGRIPLRRNDANEDQAEYLRSGGGLERNQTPTGLTPPPLRRPETPPFPGVSLSFTALKEFQDCPSRFYAERILGLRDTGELDAAAGAETIRPWERDPESTGESRREGEDGRPFGLAVHDAFEIAADRRWVPLTEREIEARLAAQGAADPDGALLSRAMTMFTGFTGSELGERARLADGRTEVPLLVEIGRVALRGSADLLLPDADPPLIIDYKTNRLDDDGPAGKMTGYGLQRDLYGLAVSRATGSPVVDTAFVFLERPDEPVITRLEPADLDAARDELEGLVAQIEAGRFFGGPEADVAPCGKCWGCRVLASRMAG